MGTPVTKATISTSSVTSTNTKTATKTNTNRNTTTGQSTNTKNKTNKTTSNQNVQKNGTKKRHYSIGPDGRKIDVTSIFEEIERESKKNIEEHDKFIKEMFEL